MLEGQISPFGVLLQTYSPFGVVLKLIPPWCCFVRGFHGLCMETASFNGEFVSTGHVDGNPLLLLAISGRGASRQRCWRFQGCAEIAALTGDFQGLRVGCRERGTKAISEALHGAAAAEQGVANGNCDLVRKPPAVLAICIR